jgi:hypothetical protein
MADNYENNGADQGTQYYQSQDAGQQQQQYQDPNQYQNQYQQQSYQPGYNYDEVPAEIKKWNWGAFVYTWIWGIGSHAYLTLLALILPGIWNIVSGILGNQWAWKSGQFKDTETFLAVQKTWNRAGLVQFIVTVASFVLGIVFYAAIFAIFANLARTGSGADVDINELLKEY